MPNTTLIPAWLLAAEATGKADYIYSFGLIDALIALLPSKREGVAIHPEKFDAQMQSGTRSGAARRLCGTDPRRPAAHNAERDTGR